MYTILCSCPPMIKQAHRYKDFFKKYNLNIVIPEFTQVLSVSELCKLLPNYDGWIIGDDPATREVFEAGKRGKLKAAVKWGVGVDNVDFDACKDLNIPITNIPGIFGEEVSDVAIGYLLCLSRKLHTIHQKNLENKWFKPCGISLTNKKVCLIGFGNIGQSIARKLLAFNMNVYVSDPAFNKDDEHNYGVSINSLNNCLKNCDFIICSCSLNKHTHHLLNKDNIILANKGVIIINISRGPVICEKDVCELLENKFIDSVGFDVFEEEPLNKNNPLRKFEQNIFGSHNGSNSIDAVDKVSKIAVEKIKNYLDFINN